MTKKQGKKFDLKAEAEKLLKQIDLEIRVNNGSW